jgi:hypothetical protein
LRSDFYGVAKLSKRSRNSLRSAVEFLIDRCAIVHQRGNDCATVLKQSLRSHFTIAPEFAVHSLFIAAESFSNYCASLSYHDRCRIILNVLRNVFAIDAQMPSHRLGIVSVDFAQSLPIAVQSLRSRFPIAAQFLHNRCGTLSQMLLNHFHISSE